MKSILERATEYANGICDRYEWGIENKEWKTAYKQYVDIASEQQDIDLEVQKDILNICRNNWLSKACRWFIDHVQPDGDGDEMLDDFRKAVTGEEQL